MNDYLDFITVDVSGFSYVLSKLIIHKLGLFYVHAMPAFKAILVELLQHFLEFFLITGKNNDVISKPNIRVVLIDFEFLYFPTKFVRDLFHADNYGQFGRPGITLLYSPFQSQFKFIIYISFVKI